MEKSKELSKRQIWTPIQQTRLRIGQSLSQEIEYLESIVSVRIFLAIKPKSLVNHKFGTQIRLTHLRMGYEYGTIRKALP